MHSPMSRFLAIVLFIVHECQCQMGSSDLCDWAGGTDATYTETIETYESTYSRRIVSSGCPNYANKEGSMDQDKDIEVMAYPCFSDTPLNVTCVGGSVGITLNGISIISRYVGGDDCSLDAVQEEGDTFDECGGHKNEYGNYHYHVAPACLIDQLNGTDDADVRHSPLVGWAFDGFPVYGPYGPDGVEMYVCDHEDADDTYCLDECDGTSQYEIDGFLYHYHFQGPLGDLTSSPLDPLPGTDRSPHSIGCLKGVIIDWTLMGTTDNGGNCSSDGYNASTYNATVTEGVTSVYSLSSSTSGSVAKMGVEAVGAVGFLVAAMAVLVH